MRVELKDSGITVTDIFPGYIQTDISKNAMVGDGSSFGKVDENILKGLKVDEATRIMLKGIYYKTNRVLICDIKIRVAIVLSNLNENIMELFSSVSSIPPPLTRIHR